MVPVCYKYRAAWGYSSDGRAARSHRAGQGFESPYLHLWAPGVLARRLPFPSLPSPSGTSSSRRGGRDPGPMPAEAMRTEVDQAIMGAHLPETLSALLADLRMYLDTGSTAAPATTTVPPVSTSS